MAKQGMKRPERTHSQTKNTASAVPEIQGKASRKSDYCSTEAPSQKVYHTTPFEQEKPISKAYPVIDNDLARDNAENDLTAVDLQDL